MQELRSDCIGPLANIIVAGIQSHYHYCWSLSSRFHADGSHNAVLARPSPITYWSVGCAIDCPLGLPRASLRPVGYQGTDDVVGLCCRHKYPPVQLPQTEDIFEALS